MAQNPSGDNTQEIKSNNKVPVFERYNVLYIDELIRHDERIDRFLQGTFNEVIYADSFLQSAQIFKFISIDLIIANVDAEQTGSPSFVKLVAKKNAGFPILLLCNGKTKGEDSFAADERFPWKMTYPLDKGMLESFLEEHGSAITAFAARRKGRFLERIEHSFTEAESIDHYFRVLRMELLQYDQVQLGSKTLSFDIMYTFLMTAFNNLKSIDLTFTDERFETIRKKFERAIGLKRSLDKKLRTPIETGYEEIFLLYQIPYRRQLDTMQKLHESIAKLSGKQDILERRVKRSKALLSKMEKGDPEYALHRAKLKEMAAAEVDILHRLQEYRERVDVLHGEMKAFREEHYDAFETVFLEKSKYLSRQIKVVLDTLAHRFDKELWRCAKSSITIREYFSQAGFRGLFSSMTYLRYYSGGIDEAHAGEETKKLLRYLKKMQQEHTKNIAIIGNNHEIIMRGKKLLESIDPSIRAMGYMDPGKVIEQHRRNRFDLLIVQSDNLLHPESLHVVHEHQKNFAKDETLFCALHTGNRSGCPERVGSDALECPVINLSHGWDRFTEAMIELL